MHSKRLRVFVKIHDSYYINMTEIYKTYQHNPPHLFKENAKYFITGSTLNRIRYFDTDPTKEKVIHYMFTSFNHFNWTIEDWVLLENHYHIVADAPENPETLSRMINNFHRFSGLWIKKHKNIVGESQIWFNYWDSCITYESSYFSRIHYIWQNPVKHGYVESPEQWKFGSYFYRDRKETEEISRQYPCDKIKIKDDF